MHPLRWDLPKLYLFLSHRNVANQTGIYIYIYMYIMYIYIVCVHTYIYIYICILHTYIYIHMYTTYIYIHISIPFITYCWFNDNQPMLLFWLEGSSIRNGGQSRSVIQRVGPISPWIPHWTTIVDHYGVVLCLFRWKHAGTAQLKKKHKGPSWQVHEKKTWSPKTLSDYDPFKYGTAWLPWLSVSLSLRCSHSAIITREYSDLLLRYQP